MDDSQMNEGSVSRRVALHRGAGIGVAIVGGAAILGLGGCESASQKRVNKLGGRIGEPIAADPQPVLINKPQPVYQSPSAAQSAASGDLKSIPSFVVARSKWTQGKPRGWLADPMVSVKRITVHHDAISRTPTGSYTDSIRRLSSIRNGHLGRGWADIGYHYAIDPSGRIWEARPLVLQGAHVKDRNPNNIGVVMFGNYEKMRPSSDAMKSLNSLLAHEMKRFRIPLNQVFTHRELASTACPGRNLQAAMISTRRSGGELAMLMRDAQFA